MAEEEALADPTEDQLQDMLTEELDEDLLEEVSEEEPTEDDDSNDEETQGESSGEEEATEEAQAEETKPEASTSEQVELSETIRKAAATFENAANRLRNTPSDQNLMAAEKAKSKLDQILERDDTNDELSAMPGGQLVKTVAEQVQQQQSDLESVVTYIQRQAESNQADLATLQERQRRADFDSQFPDLTGRYDEMTQKTLTNLQQNPPPGAGSIPSGLWDYIVSNTFSQVVEDEIVRTASGKPTAQTGKSTGKSTASVKRPKATSSVKTKSRNTSDTQPSESDALRELWADSED